ncbi:MAG: DeoR family transcriptional regulator [bacterium]
MATEADNRRLKVLEAIVREYLASAEPVGSGTLAGKYDLQVSSATIRNDMAELTEAGLLEQPHTSAGRRPTAQGYRVFVREFVGDGESLAEELRRQVAAAAEQMSRRRQEAARDFARGLAELTGGTVFVSFGDGTACLSGVANLFRQPEFREPDLLREFSDMFDRFDELAAAARRDLDRELSVRIGEENPFCPHLSSVMARWETDDGLDGLFGLLGPTRMDYDLNVGLMRALREELDS